MKASKLIEILRNFDIDEEVCVRIGFNKYDITQDISYESSKRLVIIDIDIDDVNNEIGIIS